MGQIRTAAENDLPAIKEMTDISIGNDYYTLDILRSILKRDRHEIYIMADDHDRPMAYLYVFSEPFGRAKEILHIPDDILNILPDDVPVGVYKTACTGPEYRRCGILTQFLQNLETFFIEAGDTAIMFTALELPDGKIPVDTAVRSVGFLPVEHLYQPWVTTNSYCPYCRKQFCTCNAVIYIKNLKGGSSHEEK